MLRLLIPPAIVSLLALGGVYFWGGADAFMIAAALAVLEITLSFDNAVVNAKVLERMSAIWQRRFLTWGMLFSVAGTRLLLPLFIVSIVTLTSPLTVGALALWNPDMYALLISKASASIEAFGGAFLLMVALKYFFDEGKERHWIPFLEPRLARWGRLEAIEIAIALVVLFVLSLLSEASPATVLQSGIMGIILFIVIEGITDVLGSESGAVSRAGIALFAYINVLDSAFSLDGVVGAFALTTQLPVIVVGLGIGAYFVRSLTLALVRGRALARLVYLEHGAHWAILALSLCMFLGLIMHVPEFFVASIGLAFLALSYVSSRRERGA